MLALTSFLLLLRSISALPVPNEGTGYHDVSGIAGNAVIGDAGDFYASLPVLSDNPAAIAWLKEVELRYRHALAIQREIDTKLLHGGQGDWQIRYFRDQKDLARYEFLVNRWGSLAEKGVSSLDGVEKMQYDFITKEIERTEIAMDKQVSQTMTEFRHIEMRFGVWDQESGTFSREAQMLDKLGLLSGEDRPSDADVGIIKEIGGIHTAKLFMMEADQDGEVLGRMYDIRAMKARAQFRREVERILDGEQKRYDWGRRDKSGLRALKNSLQQSSFGQQLYSQFQNQLSNIPGLIPLPSFEDEEKDEEEDGNWPHIFEQLPDDSVKGLHSTESSQSIKDEVVTEEKNVQTEVDDLVDPYLAQGQERLERLARKRRNMNENEDESDWEPENNLEEEVTGLI